MMDKVTQICSKLELLHGASPYEMVGERSYPVIWKQFDPSLDSVLPVQPPVN